MSLVIASIAFIFFIFWQIYDTCIHACMLSLRW